MSKELREEEKSHKITSIQEVFSIQKDTPSSVILAQSCQFLSETKLFPDLSQEL